MAQRLMRGRWGAHIPPPVETDGTMIATAGDFFAALGGRRPATAAGFGARDKEGSTNPTGPYEQYPPGAARHHGKPDASGVQTQDAVHWLQLGLCKALSRAVTTLGYLTPTPVQAATIPVALRGTDVCARAVTGSGKTCAYLLPLLNHLLTAAPAKQQAEGGRRKFSRALVVVPTRELAIQCRAVVDKLLQFVSTLSVELVIGGVTYATQEAALERAPDLIIATPGRLVDFLINSGGSFTLSGLEALVIDEVDRMLTVTLIDQLMEIVSRCPEHHCQMMLFSATMTSEVDEFAKKLLIRPQNIDIGHVALQAQLRQQFVRIPEGCRKRKRDGDGKNAGTDGKEGKADHSAAGLEDELEPQEPDELLEHLTLTKTRCLVALCRKYFTKSVLIFAKYRTTAHRLCILFNELGMKSRELQSTHTQEERIAALEAFAQGHANFLFATDVASRGLDVEGISTVINFDLPPTLTGYIHRVGRTARIGHSGIAVSLVVESQNSEVIKKILALSRTSGGEHQAVVKVQRRDVPKNDLEAAAKEIDDIFPKVRAVLATEKMEERIRIAEKKIQGGLFDADRARVQDVLQPAAKRKWCLTGQEQRKRQEEAKRIHTKESEVVVTEVQEALTECERTEQRFLKNQKIARRKERQKMEAKKEQEREVRRGERKKEQAKIEAGLVKKAKQKKIRMARREQRRARTAKKKGGEDSDGKRRQAGARGGRSRHVKSRHRGRMTRH